MRSFILLRVHSVRALLGAAFVAWFGGLAAADPAPPDPQVVEALAQHEKFERFFTSMRCEFVVRRQESGSPVEDHVEWILGDLGATRLQVVTRAAGVMKGRQAALTIDGRTIVLSYPSGESRFDQPRGAAISAGRGDGVPLVAAPLFRLHDPQGRSLREWLEQRDIQVGPPLSVDGTECFDWAVLSRAGFPPRRLVLARRRSCQLRLLESMRGRTQVHDHREVAPGIWFPWRGDFQPAGGGSIVEWEVQKLEFNEPIPDSEFMPPFHVGMPIQDRIEMRKYRFGIPEPEDEYEASSSFDRAADEIYRSRYLFVLLATIPIVVMVSRARRRAPPEGQS